MSTLPVILHQRSWYSDQPLACTTQILTFPSVPLSRAQWATLIGGLKDQG